MSFPAISEGRFLPPPQRAILPGPDPRCPVDFSSVSLLAVEVPFSSLLASQLGLFPF